MPIVKITQPGLKVREVLEESRRVQQHIQRNINLLNDNMAVVTFDAIHATEVPIINPFGDRGWPVGMRIVDSTGLPVASSSMRLARLTQDNRIGVTTYFEGRHTEPLLVKRLTSAMAIPNNSATTINTWQTDATAEVNRGGVISESGGTFTVSEAGSYSVALQLSYQEGVTYTNCQGRLQAAGGNNRFLPQVSAALTDAAWIAFPAIFNLAAGATFVAQGFQTNAAAASRNLLSGNGNTRIAVNRLYNSTVDGYTATVTAILYGPGCNVVDVNG